MNLFPAEFGAIGQAGPSKRPARNARAAAASFEDSLDPVLSGSGAHGQFGSSPSQSSASSAFSAAGESADDYSDPGDGSSIEDSESEAEQLPKASTTMPAGTKRRKPAQQTRPAAYKGKGKARASHADMDVDQDEDTGDFGRLVAAVRGTQSTEVGGRTAFDREFDRIIEEDLDELDDPLNNGLPNRRRKKERRRPQTEASPQVKGMLSQANQYYAQGELDNAIEILQDVIRIDPNLKVPWYTMSSIYEEKGDLERSMRFKILGTLSTPVARASAEWAALGEQCRDIGMLQEAIYCLSQAIRGNKEDVDAMWERAILLKLSGDTNKATKALLALLSVHPHDPGALRELTPMLAQLGQYSRASTLYMEAFEYYRQICPHVSPETVDLLATFDLQDLEFLCDLLLLQKLYGRVLYVVRVGVRWLQGREREMGWDMIQDDREFDLVRKTRANWQRDARFLEQAPVYDLDVRLRLRLGLARLGVNDVTEAQYHFSIVRQLDVAEVPEMFGAMGDAYLEKKMYDDALAVFQHMAECDETNDAPIWLKIGQIHFDVGDLDDALECFEAVVEVQPDNLQCKMQLAKVWELKGEPQKALALINEVVADRRRLGQDLLEQPGQTGKGGTRKEGARKPRAYASKEGRLALAAEREALEQQRHQEFTVALAALERIEDDVDQGDEDAIDEWLGVATFLVDAFRETKQFFPSSTTKKFTGVLRRQWRRKGAGRDLASQADEMASRLTQSLNPDGVRQNEPEEDVEADSFRGIDFDRWVILILKYAFLLAKNDEADNGLETLKHVRKANVFRQHPHRLQKLTLGYAALFGHMGKYVEMTNVLRTFELRYSAQSEGLRLIMAMLPGGQGAVEAFNATNLQKFLLRQLRSADEIVRGTVGERRASAGLEEAEAEGSVGRHGVGDDEQDQDQDQDQDEDGAGLEAGAGQGAIRYKPTKFNPFYSYTYGQMMLVNRSYAAAIIYLLRAYELDKNQPLINLTLGIAYMLRAMSRQTDNRHHQLAQSLAFFSQYKKLRGPCQEVEYNFARMFQHLGMQSYAVQRYHACLQQAALDRQANRLARMSVDGDDEIDDDDKSTDDPNDFSRVAAYNLSMLYMLSGQDDLARAVAQKWLSV